MPVAVRGPATPGPPQKVLGRHVQAVPVPVMPVERSYQEKNHDSTGDDVSIGARESGAACLLLQQCFPLLVGRAGGFVRAQCRSAARPLGLHVLSLSATRSGKRVSAGHHYTD